MARKGKATEEIIAALREAEVRIAQGETVGKICRSFGISEQTYCKWRREYGGLKIDQAKRLKEFERENERLKQAADLPKMAKLHADEASAMASGNAEKAQKASDKLIDYVEEFTRATVQGHSGRRK